MARVNTYLNFQGQAEEAFAFYAKIFGTEVSMISRFSDLPASAGGPDLPADERNLIMHAELPIAGGHVLMATDMVRSLGQEVRVGNNTTLCLEPDSRDEADRLYGALSEGGSEGAPMADVPWGAYWGVTLDRFGIRWMINQTAALPQFRGRISGSVPRAARTRRTVREDGPTRTGRTAARSSGMSTQLSL
jgi:PhnB protein